MSSTLVGSGVLDVAGAAALTALIVQQTKFLVEYVVKPSDVNHDNIVRLYVDIVAMAVVIIAEVVSNTLHVHNGADWFNAVVQGFGVALASISGYHLLNGMSPQTPPVVKSQPAADTGAQGARGHTVPVLQPIATSAAAAQSSPAIAASPLPVDNNTALLSIDGSRESATDSPAAVTSAVGDTNLVKIADIGNGTLASWILQSRLSVAE